MDTRTAILVASGAAVVFGAVWTFVDRISDEIKVIEASAKHDMERHIDIFHYRQFKSDGKHAGGGE